MRTVGCDMTNLGLAYDLGKVIQDGSEVKRETLEGRFAGGRRAAGRIARRV
jgi:hypothetical protein